MKINNRIRYFDVLNVLAIFCVVCMHCNGGAHVFSDSWTWRFNMLIETICYWAVPVFFMLSGATLMNYRERYSTKDFMIRRFKRTVIPFVVWSLIGAVYFRINPFEVGFVEFINRFLNTSLMAQIFWFFPCLFTVYLAMPALSLLKDNRKVLWYLAIGGFCINTVIPWALMLFGIRWNSAFNMQIVTGSVIFAIFGYLFSEWKFTKKQKTFIYFIAILSLFVRYLGTLWLSKTSGSLNQLFWGDITQVPLACGVFLFFKNNKFIARIKSQKVLRGIQFLSSCSLGVYLCHYIVYCLVNKFIVIHPIAGGILFPFLVYAISLIIVVVLKKIPVIKYIVP